MMLLVMECLFEKYGFMKEGIALKDFEIFEPNENGITIFRSREPPPKKMLSAIENFINARVKMRPPWARIGPLFVRWEKLQIEEKK